MRITGAYPPPLRPAPTELPSAADLDLAWPPSPRVTRYDRSRRRALSPRPRAARGWAATSAVLAAAGVSVLVLAPQGNAAPARLDVPLEVVAAPDTARTAAPALPATPAATSPSALAASDPVHVQIPALGVTSKIMELGLEPDGSMEVPPAGYPVGWYGRSPTPGQLGPSVLAGHVDWAGKPGAFYGIRELIAGDEIVVDRRDGTTATFRVDRVAEHGKDDFPTDEVYGDIDHAGLRLITCGGSFDADTGDYEANVIVFARLVPPA